jgi:putative transposase
MKLRYRYRIYPTKGQENLLARTFGCGRFVYNQALANAIEEYERDGKSKVSYSTLCKWLTEQKQQPETNWLKGAIRSL